MGHVFQLKREGIAATAPMFIPFLGAVVGMKEMPKNALVEARVGLAGPVLGTLGCFLPYILWQITGEPFWQALCFVGLFLNLFNLLPIVPLDGGRAMSALSPWFWIIGFAALIGLLYLTMSPILFLIVLLGGFEAWSRWKKRKTPGGQHFYQVAFKHRLLVAGVYIGLIVFLVLGMGITYLPKPIPS
jgi:Zn-dependent protease